MIERYLARGKQASDEMFLEAVVPGLLLSDMQAVITKELDPTMKRSGRPSGKKPSRHEGAGHIEQSDRTDLPSAFRETLVARLRSGKRFTDFDRAKPIHKHLEKRRWQETIKFVYRSLYDMIRVNEPTVWFEPVGEIEVPTGRFGRSQKAMMMTQDVLSGLGMAPPTVPRMFSVMSEKIPRIFRE